MADAPKPPGWQTKPPVQIPKADSASRKGIVNLRPEEFDRLIKAQGVRVNVYRTLLCPNLKSIDGGEHEIDCKVCRGNSFIDVKPITTWAFIQNQDLEKVHVAEGDWDSNAVSASFLSGIELQYFTLVELCDYTDIFYEVVKRQRGNVDVLKYRACTVHVIIDATGKEYLAQTDWDLDPNGSIRWLPNRGPETGVLYSVHYEFKAQFRAIKAMHVNRFIQAGLKSQNITFVKAPEQWLLQREYFVKRKDRKGNALDPNLIRDPDEE